MKFTDYLLLSHIENASGGLGPMRRNGRAASIVTSIAIIVFAAALLILAATH